MRAVVYVANALPVDLARIGQEVGGSGTVSSAIGFGAWGVEPTTVVEFGDTTLYNLAPFLEAVFAAYPGEEALYLIWDVRGHTIYRGEGDRPDLSEIS